MQHSFKEFLRKGGTGQYIVLHRNGAVYGGRAAPSIKAQVPHYAEIREAFAAQLDSAINDNTRMLLNALTPPDTAPWVSAPDLRDVTDAKEETLRQWDARFSLIIDEYETHPQRIRPLQASMEERLLRAFAGLINQLRQNDLGIERYIWRSRDDAKVRNSHAEHDDQVFRWDTAPADGHPGHAFNCRCYAESVNPAVPNAATLVQFSPAIEAPVEAIFRQLGIRATALTPLGAAALTALAGSALLQQFMTQAATTQRLQSAAELLGVDIGAAEGLMAAMAHELVQESVITGLGTSLPKTVEAAQIAAQAAAFFEMLNPGTILKVSEGDADAQASLGQFVQNAYDAFADGRLRLADGKIADGWVEVFPELTEGERRLGELAGFTPQRLEEWLETYPSDVLGLPIHTGLPIAQDPSGNIVSTPIPDETGPFIIEARPGEPTPIGLNDDEATQRSIRRENESAELLSDKGYNVLQNPAVAGPKKPDYLINGEIYDRYAPSTNIPRNIWSEVKRKGSEGASEQHRHNLERQYRGGKSIAYTV